MSAAPLSCRAIDIAAIQCACGSADHRDAPKVCARALGGDLGRTCPSQRAGLSFPAGPVGNQARHGGCAPLRKWCRQPALAKSAIRSDSCCAAWPSAGIATRQSAEACGRRQGNGRARRNPATRARLLASRACPTTVFRAPGASSLLVSNAWCHHASAAPRYGWARGARHCAGRAGSTVAARTGWTLLLNAI